MKKLSFHQTLIIAIIALFCGFQAGLVTEGRIDIVLPVNSDDVCVYCEYPNASASIPQPLPGEWGVINNGVDYIYVDVENTDHITATNHLFTCTEMTGKLEIQAFWQNLEADRIIKIESIDQYYIVIELLCNEDSCNEPEISVVSDWSKVQDKIAKVLQLI